MQNPRDGRLARPQNDSNGVLVGRAPYGVAMPGDTAVTIGNFDGVHLGHAALVARCRELVGDRGSVVAVAFDPHPRTVLRPADAPVRLTTFDERAMLLRVAGADEVRRLEPSPGLLSLSAGQFLRRVAEDLTPTALVEGDDFRFGKGRDGDVRALAAIGADLGFAVDVVEPVEVPLGDQSVIRASSSAVRWLLSCGRVSDAAAVLGRPHAVVGEVVPGDRRGRTIGFPTANIAFENEPPADGVYACVAELESGARHPAAVNVGSRPTVGGVERRVEAHLLGFEGEVGAYGYRVRLHFLSWVRDQMRMGSVDELAGQLHRDLDRVGDMVERAGFAALAGRDA